MIDILLIFGFLVGLGVLGPVICWALGMFNPLGYMGSAPWSAEVREARKYQRDQHRARQF
jgi:hypothetical protein